MSKSKYKKYTKQDMINIGNAYYKKLEEYSKLTLEQLQELLPTLGGTYRNVCENMIRQKQTEARIENAGDAIVNNSNTEENEQSSQ